MKMFYKALFAATPTDINSHCCIRKNTKLCICVPRTFDANFDYSLCCLRCGAMFGRERRHFPPPMEAAKERERRLEGVLQTGSDSSNK